MASLGFGTLFTDHMVTIRYTEGQGWHDAVLGPRQAIPLDPAAAVLHYAQEIFEGLKAYRLPDGSVASFRPEANAARFNASATRLAMPHLPEDLFVESIRQLVGKDIGWVPEADKGSLYLAPLHVRERGVPRRAAGARIYLLRDRFAGRRLFQGRPRAP